MVAEKAEVTVVAAMVVEGTVAATAVVVTEEAAMEVAMEVVARVVAVERAATQRAREVRASTLEAPAMAARQEAARAASAGKGPAGGMPGATRRDTESRRKRAAARSLRSVRREATRGDGSEHQQWSVHKRSRPPLTSRTEDPNCSGSKVKCSGNAAAARALGANM